jgi:hypothetical protein
LLKYAALFFYFFLISIFWVLFLMLKFWWVLICLVFGLLGSVYG